jgi:hypothetical protein
MEPLRLPTEEGIRVVVRQGEDAVVSLVNSLIQVIVVLAVRLQALEDQLFGSMGRNFAPERLRD